ncbi:MAG: hypothetical protein DWQ07_14150 [Chloroflexi bacterium]|nr:MAG: hypothetical protein DWQ07_14150 [Chloroflexota bacterium]
MSHFIEGLVARLEAMSTIAGTNIYPLVMPQDVQAAMKAELDGGGDLSNASAAIVYQQIPGSPAEVSQSGSSNLVEARYQLACWSASYGRAKTLGNEVISGVHGYSGSAGSWEIHAGFHVLNIDLAEPDTGLSREIVDVRLWHRLVLTP